MLGNKPQTPLAARMAGVRTATDGTGGTPGTPQIINNVAKADWVLVSFNDERGNTQNALYLKVGDEYYAAKDTVDWCKGLKPMSDWIKTKVDAFQKDAAPVKVADEDSVDVLET